MRMDLIESSNTYQHEEPKTVSKFIGDPMSDDEFSDFYGWGEEDESMEDTQNMCEKNDPKETAETTKMDTNYEVSFECKDNSKKGSLNMGESSDEHR